VDGRERGHVACTRQREREKKSKHGIFVAESEEEDHLKDLGIDETMSKINLGM
jgi:hypothetical protein